jgi:hypothetical protein
MQRLPTFFRWFALLVILTSTPGLGELIEGVVHAAVESGDELDHHEGDHHEAGGCDDSCPDGGCTEGFFHSCRCNAPAIALATAPPALRGPVESLATRAGTEHQGQVRPGHRTPPFRPPSV